MAGRVEVSLVRPGPGSWGLRLQGGVDVQKALTIINVADGSPSEMSGLKIGDVLLQINGRDCSMMTHKAAQDAIVGSGDRVDLLVQRWSAPAPAPQGVWKPDVQLVGAPATGPAAQGQTYTQTSLAANPVPEDSHWDVKHNITAKAFTPGEPSPGFRSVAAPVTKPGGPTPRGPPQLQVCFLCTKPIMGVFLQIKGRPACAECFVCSECKTSLRNLGHISVGDKMFCQGCANKAMQAQAPSGGPPPQGLAANLAILAARPQGPLGPLGPQGPSAPRDPNGSNMGAPQGQGQAPGDWGRRLDADGAGAASNAEEFTKQFMQQLTGGH